MNVNPSTLQIDQLHSLIEKKRQLMINNGLQYGFTNRKTVKLSQELDKLINEVIHLGGVLKQN